MIDAITHERIVILNAGGGSPYFMVAEEQLGKVSEILRAHNITHWLDDDVISIDGEPEVGFVNLGRAVDVAAVQELLDAV